MTTLQWSTLAVACAALLALGFWCLNEFLKEADLPISLGSQGAMSKCDAVSWVAFAVVVGSCATCTVVDIKARERAYKACVAAHHPDDCVGLRP